MVAVSATPPTYLLMLNGVLCYCPNLFPTPCSFVAARYWSQGAAIYVSQHALKQSLLRKVQSDSTIKVQPWAKEANNPGEARCGSDYLD